MRNFDEGKVDLEFIIAGETFVTRRVRPEALAVMAAEIPDSDTPADALRILDERILAFLGSDEDRERFKVLRAREENPLTIGQLNALLEWMIEASSDLPTELPLPSATGAGAKGSSSKAKSP